MKRASEEHSRLWIPAAWSTVTYLDQQQVLLGLGLARIQTLKHLPEGSALGVRGIWRNRRPLMMPLAPDRFCPWASLWMGWSDETSLVPRPPPAAPQANTATERAAEPPRGRGEPSTFSSDTITRVAFGSCNKQTQPQVRRSRPRGMELRQRDTEEEVSERRGLRGNESGVLRPSSPSPPPSIPFEDTEKLERRSEVSTGTGRDVVYDASVSGSGGRQRYAGATSPVSRTRPCLSV